MAYTITKTDGTLLTTILDGTINTTATSLVLPGPNYVGYGEYLDENLVRMLENFASNTAPSGTSLVGQLWYNTNTKSLNVYSDQGGGGYVPVTGITVAGIEPSIGNSGNMWYNTTTNQLYFYDGNSWNLVGPYYTKAQGPSGGLPVSVGDANVFGIVHNVIQLQFGSFVYAIVSADSEFTPQPPIPGFATIKPGININSTITNPTINSNVSGSLNGTVYGDLYGNVYATNLVGTLYGTLVGNINGNVSSTIVNAATSYNTNLFADTALLTNFSTGNAVILGGYMHSMANVEAFNGRFGNLTVESLSVTSGSAINTTDVNAVRMAAANFSTGNASITGGYINNLANLTATTGTFTTVSATNTYVNNLSAANAVITSGYINNLANLTATTGTFNSLTTGALSATSGSVNGLTSLSATTAVAANFSSGNVRITSGNVSNTVGVNNTLTTPLLINPTANTKPYNDDSTAVATTAFVQNVLPYGMIVMWSGSTANIPQGWQLCDGSSGTPDLRNRFIFGAGSTFTPGATGGNSSASISIGISNLPSHSHTYVGNVSVSGTTGSGSAALNDPGHTHTGAVNYIGFGAGSGTSVYGSSAGVKNTSSSTTGISDLGHTHSFSATGSFSGTTGTAGTGAAISVTTVPPYYALCFIMKMF